MSEYPEIEDFDEWDFEDKQEAVCPRCKKEVPDINNGGDPAAWWNDNNIPNCDLKHTCHRCGQEFRIHVDWSPVFTMVPVGFDCDYPEGLEALDEA